MSNHYYAINDVDKGEVQSFDAWTRGTSSASSTPLEVRVTDGVMTRAQAADALRMMAERLDAGDYTFIQTGNFTG